MARALYAHSPYKEGKQPQGYRAHALGVERYALQRLYTVMSEYLSCNCQGDILGKKLKLATATAIIKIAAHCHDMGKLVWQNQEVLSGKRTAEDRLPIQHDAISLALMPAILKKLKRSSCLPFDKAMRLVAAHHRGLFDEGELDTSKPSEEQFLSFIMDASVMMAESVSESDINYIVDRHKGKVKKILNEWLRLVRDSCKKMGLENEEFICTELSRFFDPMTMRLLLGCLSWGDYLDTGNYYRSAFARFQKLDMPKLRAEERLNKLTEEMTKRTGASIKTQGENSVNRIVNRSMLYSICRYTDADRGIYYLDTPVGSGKTFSGLAHMLKMAIEHGLRRIFVVIPRIDIINQNAEICRELLTLPGENPEDVVAVVHSNMDFYKQENRHLATNWEAPIIFTTNVAFCECMAQCKPYALTKFPNAARSGIIFDEEHILVPYKLWGVTYKWMCELTEKWGCHILLMSGSMYKPWERKPLRYDIPHVKAKSLINKDMRKDLYQIEHKRVAASMYIDKDGAVGSKLEVDELSEIIASSAGPRLLILNTTYSAAGVATYFKQKYGRDKVEHLSNALLPKDKKEVISRIHRRLDDPNDNDWTLVATSIVELGLNLSFTTGFKEMSSYSAGAQALGRVNRDMELESACLYFFMLNYSGASKDIIRRHPSFTNSSRIMYDLLRANNWQYREKDVETSMLIEASAEKEVRLEKQVLEYDRDDVPKFRAMKKAYKVIEEENCWMLVGSQATELMESLINDKDKVRVSDLQKYCVTINQALIHKYNCPILLDEGTNSIYLWNRPYDNFIGYYAGVFL